MIIHTESSFGTYLLKVTVASIVASTVHVIATRTNKELDRKLPGLIDTVIYHKRPKAPTFIGFIKSNV